MDRIVIVGAGLAGHRAALALKASGFGGETVMVTDENHRPYDRPPLSKQVLAGTMEHHETHYPDHDEELTWVGGNGAIGLDAEAHEVTLADGSVLGYDGLVIATGRRGRALPDLPALRGVHVLRSLDDAIAFRAEATVAERVVVVGAGFIGCEVAATLRGLGVEVTLVDVADQPMPPVGPDVGARAAALHARHGVALRMGVGIAGLRGRGGTVDAVELADGTTIDASVVLLALGSAPNTEWLEGSQVQRWRGAVRCDAHCAAVGVDDIVAAGDVAAFPHPLAGGELVCIEHWAIARDMAATAAANLLRAEDERQVFATVPTFWSDQYDVKLKSAGLLSVADGWRVVEDDPQRPALVVEALRGDEVVGAVLWNRNRKAIEYQRALTGRLAELAIGR